MEIFSLRKDERNNSIVENVLSSITLAIERKRRPADPQHNVSPLSETISSLTPWEEEPTLSETRYSLTPWEEDPTLKT